MNARHQMLRDSLDRIGTANSAAAKRDEKQAPAEPAADPGGSSLVLDFRDAAQRRSFVFAVESWRGCIERLGADGNSPEDEIENARNMHAWAHMVCILGSTGLKDTPAPYAMAIVSDMILSGVPGDNVTIGKIDPDGNGDRPVVTLTRQEAVMLSYFVGDPMLRGTLVYPRMTVNTVGDPVNDAYALVSFVSTGRVDPLVEVAGIETFTVDRKALARALNDFTRVYPNDPL